MKKTLEIMKIHLNGSMAKKTLSIVLVLSMMWCLSVSASALTFKEEWGQFPTQNTSTHTYYGTKTVQYLVGICGHVVTIDGSFGPATEEAVYDYQHDKGLTEDGSVGPSTWKRLYTSMTYYLNHAINGGKHYYIYLPISGTNYIDDYYFCRENGAWKYKGSHIIKSGF